MLANIKSAMLRQLFLLIIIKITFAFGIFLIDQGARGDQHDAETDRTVYKMGS